ncbi:MAG: hypothetical protein IJ787_06905 [Bacilli bacterium]|nr:hypothetical protein [Bacilli bacterium]
MSMRKDYPEPIKTFGTKYDQSSNQRRILICINKRWHLSKEYLNTEDDAIYRGYFDTLEQEGLIHCVDENYRYLSEGYVIRFGAADIVEGLEHQFWRKAQKELRAFVVGLTAELITKNLQ